MISEACPEGHACFLPLPLYGLVGNGNGNGNGNGIGNGNGNGIGIGRRRGGGT